MKFIHDLFQNHAKIESYIQHFNVSNPFYDPEPNTEVSFYKIDLKIMKITFYYEFLWSTWKREEMFMRTLDHKEPTEPSQ